MSASILEYDVKCSDPVHGEGGTTHKVRPYRTKRRVNGEVVPAWAFMCPDSKRVLWVPTE